MHYFWKPRLAGSRKIGWGRRELSGEACGENVAVTQIGGNPEPRVEGKCGGKEWWWAPSKENLFYLVADQLWRSKPWMSRWWQLCGPTALSHEWQGWQANAWGSQCPEMLAAMVSAHEWWLQCRMCLHLSCFSRLWLFATLWIAAHQAPLSLGFSRQEYWSGSPCSPPGDLPHPGIEPTSPALAGGFFIAEPLGKPQSRVKCQSLGRVQLFATPQSAAHQTPLSMGFSRQEYWSGSPSLLQGIFPTQGSSPHLLHCRWILYSLNPQGSP